MRYLQIEGYVNCPKYGMCVPVKVCLECDYLQAIVGNHKVVCNWR